MLKVLLNRYQNEIVLAIWIIGSILMAYFILDQDKYYITSCYESYYQGKPIYYFNYTVNGKGRSFGSANVDIYNGYPQDRLTRRAMCDRWDKFLEQGYFKAPKKFSEGKIGITFLICFLLTPLVLCNTREHWKKAYNPDFINCDRNWCHKCRVCEYCPHSNEQHWIFKWVRIRKKQFLGY